MYHYFKGDIENDRCPISLRFIREISNPVGFDAKHAFECDDLVLWLTQVRATNPMTSQRVCGDKVADVVRPMVVDGNNAHVKETRKKLILAGFVQGSVRKVGLAMPVNLILFILVSYVFSLSKLKDFLGSSNATMSSLLAVLISFAHLASDTCKSFPHNGRWIVLNFFVVGMFVFCTLEVFGICSPGVNLATKIAVLHSGLLTMRVMFDINRAMGVEIQ